MLRIVYILAFLSIQGVGMAQKRPATEAEQAGSYLKLSKMEEANKNLDQAQALAQKAISLFTKLHQSDQLGESYVSLWSVYTSKGMPYTDRIAVLQQADTAFKAAGNKLRQADCLIQIGDLSQIMEDFASALPALQESLQLYKAVHYKNLQGIYDLLGNVYYSLGDYKTGIEYGLLAAKTAEETGDSSLTTCTINNHLAMAYYYVRDDNNAKSYFERSLAIAMKYNDIASIKIVSLNYNYLLLDLPNSQDALTFALALRKTYPKLDTLFRGEMSNLMTNIYLRLNTPQKAMPFCRIIEEELAHENRQDAEYESHFLRTLILFHIQTGDYSNAARYLERFDRICQRVKSGRYDMNNLYCKFKLDSARGDYFLAFKHLQQYVHVKDSLVDEKKSRAINQMNILYETEKKDKNIRALEQQTVLQENRIQQEKIVRHFILAGAGLFIVIAVLLYRAYRTKQQNNTLLQAHQSVIQEKNQSLQQLVTEREWLVKEIHHRVKNNLHMVVALLARQAEYIKGEEARDAIHQSQHRIQAMSLLHQRLYQAEDLTSIDMPSYIHELVEYLKSSFDRNTAVCFSLDIARVSFPLLYSIPIGLILNEAVTNAIKYAFPAGQEGTITIRLQETTNHHFTLSIHDNGIGLPPHFSAKGSPTLGVTLMAGLSGDIDAHFSMTSTQGTHIDIDFVVS